MMVIYETEYGNFSRPEDLLQYMQEEGIETVHMTTKLCGDVIGKVGIEMTIMDIRKWIQMGKECKTWQLQE